MTGLRLSCPPLAGLLAVSIKTYTVQMTQTEACQAQQSSTQRLGVCMQQHCINSFAAALLHEQYLGLQS